MRRHRHPNRFARDQFDDRRNRDGWWSDRHFDGCCVRLAIRFECHLGLNRFGDLRGE
jgi:hypothetical protein